MQALLDTHALLWWLDGDKRLSEPARDFIGEEANTVFVSAASAWEIPTKVRIGKLPGAVEAAAGLAAAVTSQGFTELPISITDGTWAGSLPGPLRDPFDRMLIAQSMIEEMPIVTRDSAFAAYELELFW